MVTLGDTGRSSYTSEAIDALSKCRLDLQQNYPGMVFDNRTILCLLPPIRFAKGINISSVSNNVCGINVIGHTNEMCFCDE